MLISVLGVIMIVATVAAIAYVGFSVVSSSLTGGISSGTQYDQLAELKNNYSNLEVQYNETGNKIYMMNNITLEREYVNAQVELVRVKNDISDVESALSMGKPASEVDKRLQLAKDDLKIAQEAYNSLSVK
jgi:flagellar basal body-associated protein FliL